MPRRPNGASSIYKGKGKDGGWHGRVTVGVKDDGRPDRRHVRGKTQAEVIRKVRALERDRDAGGVRRAGQVWTVGQWLTHWVENIAAAHVRENTLNGYRVAVNTHLIPGVGKHRLDRLEPEHLERLYARMMRNGSAAGTAHQAHRTVRTALNEAVRRGHLTRNPATIAKAPRLSDDEPPGWTKGMAVIGVALGCVAGVTTLAAVGGIPPKSAYQRCVDDAKSSFSDIQHELSETGQNYGPIRYFEAEADYLDAVCAGIQN